MTEGFPLAVPAPRHDLVTTVAEAVGRRIVSGQIQPGETLPSQDGLSEELQVSRPVIREAAKVLESKGLLQSRPRTGMRVRNRSDWHLLDPSLLAWQAESAVPDPAFIRNLLEVRFTVEPMAARLAAQRATQGDLSRIQRALDLMTAQTRRNQAQVSDLSRFIAADLEFHQGVLAAAHNELFLQIFAPISEVLKISDRYSSLVPGAKEDAMPIHAGVVQAIRQRNPSDAEQAMHQLVARAAGDLQEYLTSHDASTAGANSSSAEPLDWVSSSQTLRS